MITNIINSLFFLSVYSQIILAFYYSVEKCLKKLIYFILRTIILKTLYRKTLVFICIHQKGLNLISLHLTYQVYCVQTKNLLKQSLHCVRLCIISEKKLPPSIIDVCDPIIICCLLTYFTIYITIYVNVMVKRIMYFVLFEVYKSKGKLSPTHTTSHNIPITHISFEL